MSSKDDSFRSITGALESAEPVAGNNSSQALMTSARDNASADGPQPSTSASASASASASESGPAAPARRQMPSGPRPLNVSASPSTATSPLSSRDTSPSRPHPRQQPAPSGAPLSQSGLRSRKNSTDVSPNRGPGLAGPSTTVPSAAAIQRALSSATIPQLQPATSQDPSRVPRPSKSNSGTNSGDNTPHWPISPRLKSPPPSSDRRARSGQNSVRNQSKGTEPTAAPAIVVQSSSPAPLSRIPAKDDGPNSDPEEQVLGMKTASRGASGAVPKLETVQEGSLPATPGFDGLDVPSISTSAQDHKAPDEDSNDATSKVTEDLSEKPNKQPDAGSDRAKMNDPRSASLYRPAGVASKSSFASVATSKSRAETSTGNMTVETETVPSIAQATIGNQERSASGRGEGSLRLKPSIETIRPKRDKQRPKRKAPSINSGTGRSPHAPISYHRHHPSRPDSGTRSTGTSSLGSPVSYRSYDDRRSTFTMSPPSPEMIQRLPFLRSPVSMYSYSSTDPSSRKASSKADVFEQKVANTMDETNSSDSDATFIYESNPPDQQPHRSRHHSRTPSMTSLASLADPRIAVRDAHRNPGKKPSMKFANPYNANAELEGSERGDGTLRVASGRASAGSHHHHIGRHGQGRGALSHVLIDSDSSLPQSSRARGPSSRHPSQPNSPRYHTFSVGNGHANGNGVKNQNEFSSYDVDAENAADDERTPLNPNGRSPRARTRRPNTATVRRHRRSGGWCRRFAGCLVLAILVLVLIFSAVGMVVATTKPLIGLKVREIQNVVASQEELMLDLVVDAVNPNVIGVTIADMDVNVFAKSKHVGSSKWWREHSGRHHNEESWRPISDKSVDTSDNVDEGTDPDDPVTDEPRTMLLGRVFHFDSALNFEGSPLKRRRTQSLGGMRLSKPGNKTETGGTERWEEVLEHPFQLIVRGVFKYQLPLSTRETTVSVTASYYYDPDTEKKKLKAVDVEKRHLLSRFVQIPSTLLGRYDSRGRSAPLPLGL